MAIAALLPSLLPVVGDVLDRFFPNKEEKARAAREIEAKLAEHLAKIDIAQLEVNKQEAASQSMFVAGWRPSVGWICSISMAYHFIVQPLLVFILKANGIEVDLPEFDFAQLSTILMGMLGLGGLRTYEKMQGVAREK